MPNQESVQARAGLNRKLGSCTLGLKPPFRACYSFGGAAPCHYRNMVKQLRLRRTHWRSLDRTQPWSIEINLLAVVIGDEAEVLCEVRDGSMIY